MSVKTDVGCQMLDVGKSKCKPSVCLSLTSNIQYLTSVFTDIQHPASDICLH